MGYLSPLTTIDVGLTRPPRPRLTGESRGHLALFWWHNAPHTFPSGKRRGLDFITWTKTTNLCANAHEGFTRVNSRYEPKDTIKCDAASSTNVNTMVLGLECKRSYMCGFPYDA